MPSAGPTKLPTSSPSHVASAGPTLLPSAGPTKLPTSSPSHVLSGVLTYRPTPVPSGQPTAPTPSPSHYPTWSPTRVPTPVPTEQGETAPPTYAVVVAKCSLRMQGMRSSDFSPNMRLTLRRTFATLLSIHYYQVSEPILTDVRRLLSAGGSSSTKDSISLRGRALDSSTGVNVEMTVTTDTSSISNSADTDDGDTTSSVSAISATLTEAASSGTLATTFESTAVLVANETGDTSIISTASNVSVDASSVSISNYSPTPQPTEMPKDLQSLSTAASMTGNTAIMIGCCGALVLLLAIGGFYWVSNDYQMFDKSHRKVTPMLPAFDFSSSREETKTDEDREMETPKSLHRSNSRASLYMTNSPSPNKLVVPVQVDNEGIDYLEGAVNIVNKTERHRLRMANRNNSSQQSRMKLQHNRKPVRLTPLLTLTDMSDIESDVETVRGLSPSKKVTFSSEKKKKKKRDKKASE